jgi:hypothetical protein
MLIRSLRLHRIALEVIPDPSTAYTEPIDPANGFTGSGSYLSCLGENVGVRKAEGPRQAWNVEPELPNVRLQTPDRELADPFDVMRAGQAGPVAAKNEEIGRERASTFSADASPVSNDGGKVRKMRRLSAVSASPIQGPLKGRKRGSSFNASASDSQDTPSAGGLWTQDAGEAGIWTIASTGELMLEFELLSSSN